MRKAIACFAVVLIIPCVIGQAPPTPTGPSITVPSTVQVDVPGLIVVRATALDADDTRWWVYGSGIQTFPPDVVAPKPGVFLGLALQPGVYKVGVICAKAIGGKAVLSIPSDVVITVGTPTPPIPPTPPTPPTPPLPPTPTMGARVLILYESAALSTIPKEQQAVLYSKDVRDYLTAKLPKEDGKAAWRIWDKDADAKDESKGWQDTMARPHPTIPWLYVSNGRTASEGPLPGNVADTMAVLKKVLES